MGKSKTSSLVDTRVIYCGDNLEQLRKLPDACVDLVYIDPPFNSNRNYEVFWGETKEKRSFEDRHASTAAYIEFMHPRCVQLARVLKKTGSFYYHCDWHASHYVKVMLDQILGESQFQNEIIWKRTTSHGDSLRWSHVHDTILFYAGSGFTWNPQYWKHEEGYISDKYSNDDGDGRGPYTLDNMTSPNPRPNMMYEWMGFESPPKGWRYQKETMQKLHDEGRIYYPKLKDGTLDLRKRPRLKRYLREMQGLPISSIWYDIPPVNSQAGERLGYPTQKPIALLDRIITASTNPNDVVLDAFCGCGTALVAAENLGRQWIGIDVSPTACRVMAKRMRDVSHIKEDEALWRNGRGFVVRDLPWSEEKLRALPPFEFENWAVIALGGRPNKAQVGDKGIDGRIYLVSAMPEKVVAQPPSAGEEDGKTQPRAAVPQQQELGFMDEWYPIQVKQKDKAGRQDIDAFETAMNRAKRAEGFFIAFGYTSDAYAEIQRFFTAEHKRIHALTVREILDEEIAKKMG